MKTEATFQGRVVDVLEVKGGWTTILDGMKQHKVRNGELTPVAKAKAGKPAPAPVAKAKAEPKPVGERLVKPDLARYHVSEAVTTPSGRKAVDINDATAAMLRGTELSETYSKAADATGIPEQDLHSRYVHLNAGMQRMNLGNLIRGAAAKAAKAAEKARAATTKANKAAAKAAAAEATA